MNGFFDILNSLEEYTVLTKALASKDTPIHITGCIESQKIHLISALLKKNFLIVAGNELAAKHLYDDLSFFVPDCTFIPSKELVFYNFDAMGRDVMHEKMAALGRIENSSAVVTSLSALLQFVTPKNRFTTLVLELGMSLELTCLVEKLSYMGYVRTDIVEVEGQFSVRGGIVDIYPPQSDPIRTEFFDDDVDSIRIFDPITQISSQKITKAEIIPAAEADETGSLLSYIPQDWAVVFDEPARLNEQAAALNFEIEETIKSLIEKGDIKEPKDKYINEYSWTMKELLKRQCISVSALSHQTPDFKPKKLVSILTKGLNSYGGKLDFLIDDLKHYILRKYRVILLAGSHARAKSLIATLEDNKIEATYFENFNILTPFGTVAVTHGSLSKGFEYPLINTVIISDMEIFPSEKKKRRHKSIDNKNKIKDYTELTPGDYVVHNVHGIGRYVSIQRLEYDGVKKDYLKIAYRGEDYLYVGVSQLDSLHKFRSGVHDGELNLKLNKLGGQEWSKAKTTVKKNVIDIAEKLVALYAERQRQGGHSFSPDTPWQREFEGQFIYEETGDQLRAIEEMKEDMEKPSPMDRLLCGDVGFGKTEVAIRGAFKCVMDSMQVAYLVPTTILAAQHYANFVQRMKDYPIKIEMLSRFRSAAQQKETIKKLKSGEVDIVIGTHRLLQKDIGFKDLGLLIIDEEQRFGVTHKEKIKDIKKNVDVITLTATPIPRSLHMSMIGIRDMSVLTEPPEDRHPVQTFVLEHNTSIIAEAISREVARGGQVYYLFNRVSGIERVAEKIKALVPDINIAVAHGQMNETALEDIMMRLMEGEIDVLVCTTIIETGLDIPNVNTIIIENADHMGLAQLYQLRGRVGRSNRLAYAYLTYKKDKILVEKAEKRLRAIKEFTEFGSGFRIALRDLELRGAGNVLGAQQHGFMETVGYDVYCQLLNEAVRELRGEPEPQKTSTAIDLNINAYIEEEYIKSPVLRIEVYKKIAGIESVEDSYLVEDELVDRYGDPPNTVRRLIEIALIRNLASEIGVAEIKEANGSIVFYFNPKAMPSLERISELIGKSKGKILFGAGEKPYLSIRNKEKTEENVLNIVKKLLQSLKPA